MNVLPMRAVTVQQLAEWIRMVDDQQVVIGAGCYLRDFLVDFMKPSATLMAASSRSIPTGWARGWKDDCPWRPRAGGISFRHRSIVYKGKPSFGMNATGSALVGQSPNLALSNPDSGGFLRSADRKTAMRRALRF
jgi:hypothetical protein